MDLSARLARRAADIFYAKPFLIRGKKAVVSFTFDDFPRSALTSGGAILNRHGVSGTFYAAGGLTDRIEGNERCHSRDDIAAAMRDGHEIASHGFDHKPYASLDRDAIQSDYDRNDEFLAEFLDGNRPVSFSYPFGSRNIRSKRKLSKLCVSARSIRPGVNRGVCDLADLRANSIYAHKTTEPDIARLLSDVGQRGGWIIFYTHDVSDSPSPYGCTPQLLEFAVAQAVRTGCTVLPVRNAIGAIAFA